MQIDFDFPPNQSKCLALMRADQRATRSTTGCRERSSDWEISPVSREISADQRWLHIHTRICTLKPLSWTSQKNADSSSRKCEFPMIVSYHFNSYLWAFKFT